MIASPPGDDWAAAEPSVLAAPGLTPHAPPLKPEILDIMAAIFGTPAPLYEAILRGDHTRLQSLLFGAAPEDLDLGPVSLWHAAALAGDATAVRLLAAAGAPVASADQLVDVTAGRFGSLLSPAQCMAARPHGTPMSAVGLAVCGGHADVVAALLAGGDQGLAAGQFILPHEGGNVLLCAAALTDCPAMLELFVAAAPPLLLSQQLGQKLLCKAAQHGCLRLLQHVADAAAGSRPAAECPLAAAWLAPAFHTLRVYEGAPPRGARLLSAAARGDQAAAVRVLMAAGFPVTCHALSAAVSQFSHATLEVLLKGQVPEPPACLEWGYGRPDNPLPLPSDEADEPYCLCPITEAFYLRVALALAGVSYACTALLPAHQLRSA